MKKKIMKQKHNYKTVSSIAIAPTAIGKLTGSFVCDGILFLLYSVLNLVKNATGSIMLSIIDGLPT